MSWLNDATDWLGLTDTKAADRGVDTYNKGINSANENLSNNLQPLYSQYQTAMNNGKGLDESISNYDDTTNNIINRTNELSSDTQNEANNALTASNIQSYMNPYAQQKANAAAQSMAGRAGSSLQSSAMNQDMANAAAQSYGNDYNTAAQTAQLNYGNQAGANTNEQSNLAANAGLASNQMSANLTPWNQYQDLLTSQSTQQYNADVAGAGTNAALQGQNKSWLGNLAGNAATIASAFKDK